MKYRASNGSTVPVELTEDEARSDYELARDAAGHGVDGTFGKTFTTYVVARNGYGRPYPVGETTYTPIRDA